MTTPSPDSRVGDLVAERPGRSRVFAALGIDFCCGGKKTLRDACAERQLDAGAVLASLADVAPLADEPSWTEAPLGALCDHIQSTHHAFTRAELPRIAGLLEKVARVHGVRHPEMIEVSSTFAAFAAELATHMDREERGLFPAVRENEAGPAVDLAPPILVMTRQHDEAGAALARMRELTRGFTPPADGCNTFRAALGGLAELEADLHTHVHLENNILFPRALRRATQGR